MTQTNSNNVSQLVLSGLKEIIGAKELTQIIPAYTRAETDESTEGLHNLPEPDLQKVSAAMESHFGIKELQGLLMRTGRASCKFFVKKYGPEMQITSLDYRLLPSKRRLMTGLKAAAGLWSELFSKQVSVIDDGDQWIWQEDAPHSRAIGHECYFTMGLLQEYLAWLSGGKAFSVKKDEKSSSPEMAYCLVIKKQPLE